MPGFETETIFYRTFPVIRALFNNINRAAVGAVSLQTCSIQLLQALLCDFGVIR
jgi:hypothetical protein